MNMKQINQTLLKKFTSSLILLLLTGNLSCAQSNSKFNSVDSVIEQHMINRHIPGFSYVVIKGKETLSTNSYGQANIDNKNPMTNEGIMNIGSISKTFTTTAIMQLWEKGLVDLHTNINEYLDFKIVHPNYPDTPITIFQLLTHTSSIKDGKAYGHSYSCGDPTLSLNDWIIHNLTLDGKYYYRGSSFADWSPGARHRYSNIAFGLLGLIVEKVTNLPFTDYCKKNIFDPIEMNSTSWLLSEINIQKHIIPYTYVSSKKDRNEIIEDKKLFPNESDFAIGSFVGNCLYSFPNYPDGLVRTSVKELSQFMIAIMNGGEYNGSRILKKETINKMLSLQIENNDSQGLCWRKYKFNSLWGHSGGDPGITTYMVFNPKNKIGIITFQNSSTGGQMKIIEELYQIAKNK